MIKIQFLGIILKQKQIEEYCLRSFHFLKKVICSHENISNGF